MRPILATLIWLALARVFGQDQNPIPIRIHLAAEQPTQSVGGPVYVAWAAENLSRTNRPVVIMPRDAKNAESLLTMLDAEGHVLESIPEIRASQRLEKAKEIMESSKNPTDRVHAQYFIWSKGGRGPRSVFPSSLLRPGELVTGRWDIAELYTMTAPGLYTLIVTSKLDAIEFCGTTKIRIPLIDERTPKNR